MTIFLVSPKMSNPNGGIAVWTDIYISECEKNGITPLVLNIAPLGKRAENGSAKRSIYDEFVRTKNIFRDLRKMLKNHSPDVVHLNSSCVRFGIIRDYFIARKIRNKKIDAKIIAHFHCDIPMQIGNKLSRHYLSRLARVSDENFVLCENSKSYLEREFGASSVKVPNFVSDKLVISQNKEINSELKKAFFVGRVSVEKGARELYELARKNADVTFVLAGAISEDVKCWEKPDNVQLLGVIPHSKVIEHMDEADVFVFPSKTEGFSMALAEAMARGLPSIATDVGANMDMLENSGGVVCESNNIDMLLEGFSSIRDFDIRSNMSLWCVNKVRTQYVSGNVVAMFFNHYNRLLGKNR